MPRPLSVCATHFLPFPFTSPVYGRYSRPVALVIPDLLLDFNLDVDLVFD